jgi:two-component system LytT family response regulator
MLQDTQQPIQIMAECDDLSSGVRAIRQYKPQVVFLDIEMPGQSGIEILNFFEEDEVNFELVFTTGYSEYAIQAFKLSATDYLLKPISPTHLQATLDRIEKKKNHTGLQEYKVLYENLSMSKDTNEKCIAINLNSSTRFIKVKDIVTLKAEGSYCELRLANGEKLLASKNLKHFEERLEGFDTFFRSHKSYIINLRFVSEFQKSDGAIKLQNQVEAFISNDKYDLFLNKMESL